MINLRAAMALALVGLWMPAPPAIGETDFTFRRVAPPAPGTTKRITIQLAPPAAPPRVLDKVIELDPADPEVKTVVAVPDKADPGWFWGRVSPRLADAGYGKLPRALRVLQAEAEQAARLTPSAAQISRIIDTYGTNILAATAGTEVSPALVAAVVAVESAGRADAVSPAGAKGLMQLMPATAKRFGVPARDDPNQSLRGGVAYLAFLLDEFRGEALLALAGYNAGVGSVARSSGVPNYPETRAYVPKVVAAWSVARTFCTVPPLRATDGCLFDTLRLASD